MCCVFKGDENSKTLNFFKPLGIFFRKGEIFVGKVQVGKFLVGKVLVGKILVGEVKKGKKFVGEKYFLGKI